MLFIRSIRASVEGEMDEDEYRTILEENLFLRLGAELHLPTGGHHELHYKLISNSSPVLDASSFLLPIFGHFGRGLSFDDACF